MLKTKDTRRRGPKAAKLKKLIEQELGETVIDVWYEPIHGPCFEMQGYQGGWYYTTEEGGEDCLGYNFAEAVEMIRLTKPTRTSPDFLE